MVEPQHKVRAGDQRMGDADIGTKVAANHDVVSGCKGALRPVMTNGQHRRGWLTHRFQLYRYARDWLA